MIYYAVREQVAATALPRIIGPVFETPELAQAYIDQKRRSGYTHQYAIVRVRRTN